jgi:hypothetical protein
MDVKRLWKKAQERYVWATILKEALIKLYEQHANVQEERANRAGVSVKFIMRLPV